MSGDDFKVIAIIAARNEADVIPQLLDDLARQNVSAYLIDDGSSDDTVALAGQWLERGLLGIERRPDTGTFHWSEILERKEELAMELPAAWFIHQDADEFHESPWPHLNLLDAIRQVDALGYNAIDFRLLNFRPTDADAGLPGDVRAALTYFEGAEVWDAMQIKCWKKTGVRVDLHSSGGHAAAFEGRMVCPIAFLTRHYPIRSQAHGVQKVLRDRRPRFSQEERGRGWHVQYDNIDGSGFVWQANSLTRYDPLAVKQELMSDSRVAQLTQQLDAQARQHAQEMMSLRQLNSAAAEDLESARRELAAARLEVAAARSEAEETRRTVEQIHTQSELKRRALENGLATLAAELRAVYDSHSWRISGPLRAVYGWLLKMRSDGRRREGKPPRH